MGSSRLPLTWLPVPPRLLCSGRVLRAKFRGEPVAVKEVQVGRGLQVRQGYPVAAGALVPHAVLAEQRRGWRVACLRMLECCHHGCRNPAAVFL